jgi:UDP-N-acetylmuramate--alanine ligase
MYGKHNVLNALAAISVASEMGISEDIIRKGLSTFQGVKRRFTKIGEVNSITIIDDYGHHPVEIAAALDAAKLACDKGRVFAIVQPHRFTRLRDLFDDFCRCFEEADIVFVSDVFSAGEKAIKGFDRKNLVDGINKSGLCEARSLEEPTSLASKISDIAKPGDLIIFLGAGTITTWAQSLPNELEKIFGTNRHHQIMQTSLTDGDKLLGPSLLSSNRKPAPN